MNKKPLYGIKVLDLGQGVAAPYCGLLLAQYGAEVIKVEPINGDWARGLGAPKGDQTAYSIYYNLGKKGIAIDLKTKEGLDVILKLASNSDVVLENFRPGVVDRLGIGFEDVRALNSKVCYMHPLVASAKRDRTLIGQVQTRFCKLFRDLYLSIAIKMIFHKKLGLSSSTSLQVFVLSKLFPWNSSEGYVRQNF